MPVPSIPVEKKLSVLKYYEEEGHSIARTCRHFNVSPSAFKLWRKLYELNGVKGLETDGAFRTYTQEQKMAAVQDYLSGQRSQLETVLHYNISSTAVLRRWLNKYTSHGKVPSDQKGNGASMTQRKKTTLSERLDIVLQCLASNKDYRKITDEYKVSYNQVYQWVKKYETGGEAALVDNRGRRKPEEELSAEDRMKIELRAKEAENQRLKAELALLKKLEEFERRRS